MAQKAIRGQLGAVSGKKGVIHMLNILNLWEMENGQTMVEYGLLLALISVVVIGTLVATGGNIDAFFQSINRCLDNNPATACP